MEKKLKHFLLLNFVHVLFQVHSNWLYNHLVESGEVFFWGTRFGYEHAPPTAIIHIPPEPSKRAISITSSKTDMAVILTTKMPTWVEIKPLLVGWLKDTNCSFHYSHGLPLFTLQYIIELAWNCDICLQVPRL